MRGTARLGESAAAKLLMAAALIDAVFVFVLLETTGAVLQALIAEIAPERMSLVAGLAPELRQAVEIGLQAGLFLALLLLYWIVCDLLLAGRSVGRGVLMLTPQQRDGSRATALQMWKRGIRKIWRFGLNGLSVVRADSYDRAAQIAWKSPLAAGDLRMHRNWVIEVKGGRSAGRSQFLGRLDRFNRYGVIQIGRDPNWADIVLGDDDRVSGHHAILRYADGRWEIRDHGGGRGTPNKTRVNGKAIRPNVWVAVSPPLDIRVADVDLRLRAGGA